MNNSLLIGSTRYSKATASGAYPNLNLVSEQAPQFSGGPLKRNHIDQQEEASCLRTTAGQQRGSRNDCPQVAGAGQRGRGGVVFVTDARSRGRVADKPHPSTMTEAKSEAFLIVAQLGLDFGNGRALFQWSSALFSTDLENDVQQGI